MEIGTLLDNGCKWQKSRIGWMRIDFAFALTLYDGPELEPSLRLGVFETRPVRWCG